MVDYYEYQGTSGDDLIDQEALGISDWTTDLLGLEGDDVIIGGYTAMDGGPGDDTLISLYQATTIQYFTSPSGVYIDLSQGYALDGWGGWDTLIDVRTVKGSHYPDTFVGSDAAENFWVQGGDTVEGGGGIDTITLWGGVNDWHVAIYDNHTGILSPKNNSSIEISFSSVEKIVFNDDWLFTSNQYELVGKYHVLEFTETSPYVANKMFDLNSDGALDLVVAGGSYPPSGNFELPYLVLLQNADGGFRQADIYGVKNDLTNPTTILSGNFNGDGISDLVIGASGYDSDPHPGETSALILSNTDGSWYDASNLLPQVNAMTHSLAVGDINRDGLDDIYMGNIHSDTMEPPRLLLNNAGTGFTEIAAPSLIGSDVFGIDGIHPITSELYDFDNDGYLDLLVGGSAVFNSAGLWIYYGNETAYYFESEPQRLPTGLFGAPDTITPQHALLDINSDGLVDIVASQTQQDPFYAGRAIQLLVQSPDRTWRDETEQRISGLNTEEEWAKRPIITDLNSDGHQDIYLTGAVDGTVKAYVNDGTGYFNPASLHNGVPEILGFNMSAGANGSLFQSTVTASGILSIYRQEISAGVTGPNLSFPADAGAPGFNEQYYLNQNPAVAASVDSGKFNSGLEHYLALGREAGYAPYAPGTTVWGRDAIDTVYYNFNLDTLAAVSSSGTVEVNNSARKDTLISIERIVASDSQLAFDLDAHAGKTAKILGAVFGADSISNKEYAGIGLSLLDGGMSYEALAGLAIGVTGAASHTEICELLWKNVVGVPAEAADIAPYVQMLDNEDISVSELVVLAADTVLNAQNIDLVGLSTTGLEYTPVV